MRALTLLLFSSVTVYAEKVPMDKLIEMTKSHSPDLEQMLKDTLGTDAIQKGMAVDGIGKDFIWVVAAPSQPKLKIGYDDDITAVSKAGSLWVYQGPMTTGTAHKSSGLWTASPSEGNPIFWLTAPRATRSPAFPKGS
jgi:hypothetical protein